LQAAWQKLPWAVRLGFRTLRVDQVFPLVDRVVLVPDAATYVDELAKWSYTRGRWPVLIEDPVLAPMFVRRFKPAQLVRRESVKTPLPASVVERQKVLENIVVHAFGGSFTQSIKDIFAAQQYAPAGVIITSVDDPAWTAGVALAAGHGEPLLWMNQHWGGIDETLNDADAHALAKMTDDLVASCGYTYDAMGDDVDTITFCRSLPGKAIVKLAPAAQMGAGKPDEPVATSDFLGRHGDGFALRILRADLG